MCHGIIEGLPEAWPTVWLSNLAFEENKGRSQPAQANVPDVFHDPAGYYV
jgi:hypothetical protein